MKQWFVTHTQPSKEFVAQQHLLEQNFDVYLPRYQRIRRHARKVETVLSPLFPRYLFVSLDLASDYWRSVNGTRGVSYLLTTNDQPTSVSDLVIAELKAREDQEGIVPVSSLSIFMKGDKVRICEGAFEGQEAVFEKLNDNQRVQLLLNFLGRESRVTMPIYAVEAV